MTKEQAFAITDFQVHVRDPARPAPPGHPLMQKVRRTRPSVPKPKAFRTSERVEQQMGGGARFAFPHFPAAGRIEIRKKER